MKYLLVLFVFLASSGIQSKAALYDPFKITDAKDTVTLTKSFLNLFEDKNQRIIGHFIADAFMPGRESWHSLLVGYMEEMIQRAQDPDILLFFLAEPVAGILKDDSTEEWIRREKWQMILSHMNFAMDVVQDFEHQHVNSYSLHEDEKETRLIMDRSPDPFNNLWKITYTMRHYPGEIIVNVVTDAGDRYGRYPDMLFMRFRNNKILYTTPAPDMDDFYKNGTPVQYPETDDIPDMEDEPLAAPELKVLFEELTADNRLIKAFLFQINRNAYVPAADFIPECYLIYQWDGKQYHVKEKVCE